MKVKSGLLGLIAVALLASCSTGNDVVSGRNIQKRKYNDGFYIASGDKFKGKSNDVKSEETVAAENNVAEVNDVFQPLVAEAEAPSLTAENAEQTIPAGTSEELVSVPTVAETEDVTTTDKSVSRSLNINKTEKKVTFKPGRVSAKTIQQTVEENSGAASADAMLILLVILCLFIPPLAVFIFEGASGRFWIDLILFIIGIAVVGWFLNGIAGLALLVSIIYALLIVLSVI